MIKGLPELKRKISDRGVKGMVNRVMTKYTKKVVKTAKEEAPSVITFLDNGASTSQATNVGSSIFGFYRDGVVNIEALDTQAPYIEFGTGRFAADLLSTYPTEWQDIAADFYENGKGTLMSYPYLYPAVTNNEPFIAEELQKELND